jgi:predicted transcriptional regulator
MSREAQDVTEAELAILEILWREGSAPIRRITDAIYPRASTAQYATVQKQLERLEAKGFVNRDRSMFVHVFSPAVARDELIGRRLQAVVDKLCGGSLAPILSHLAGRTAKLTDAERKALRGLIDQPEEPKPAKGAGRRKE